MSRKRAVCSHAERSPFRLTHLEGREAMAWRNCREVAGREREVRAAGKNATSPTSRPKARAVFVRNASATEVDAPKTTAVEASPPPRKSALAMGLAAIARTATIRVIVYFMFMPSDSLSSCFVAMARPRDFVIPRLSDTCSLFGMRTSRTLTNFRFQRLAKESKGRPKHRHY